jgi:phage/plasmid-like protein (TIGR03299 family)
MHAGILDRLIQGTSDGRKTMPANVGEMFYTGEMPWHGLGISLARPATLDEAIKVGGLDWKVGEVEMLTADDPPSPVSKRKALVRLDRLPGDERRVLGVVHRGFTPIQNRDAGLLFDAIFGAGDRVYHTGGYLGEGEVIWLLAKIDKTLQIGQEDIVEPYALMANSHDGSMAFNIRLTTIRVVCQNTLAMAMHERLGQYFKRAHQGSFAKHSQAAQEFFKATLRDLDFVAESYIRLANHRCPDETFRKILTALLPLPKKPRDSERNPGLLRSWEKRVAEAENARKKITELRVSGKGMDLEGSRGTFWGVLNAILEYVDHHREIDGSRVTYVLFGDGMTLKTRAFQLIQDEVQKAA